MVERVEGMVDKVVERSEMDKEKIQKIILSTDKKPMN